MPYAYVCTRCDHLASRHHLLPYPTPVGGPLPDARRLGLYQCSHRDCACTIDQTTPMTGITQRQFDASYAQHLDEYITPNNTRPRKIVTTVEELDALPKFSVVQFRGESLGANNRVVWQLDEAWFPAGSEEYMYSKEFPPEAFPAHLLWTPEQPNE